jgi:hypothetical protein
MDWLMHCALSNVKWLMLCPVLFSQQEMSSSILIIASSVLLVVDLGLGLMEARYPILMENMASVETPTWLHSPESMRPMASTGQANPK